MDIMRKHFTISLAGVMIEIETVTSCVCVHCMDYLTEGTPDFKIKVTEDDIRQVFECTETSQNAVNSEIVAVHQKIAEKLLDYNYILMHGAVIAVGDKAYMFSAPSGTGKTTHIRLWLKNVNDSYVINGDKPLIKVAEDKLIACGTPWSGYERMNTNTMKPLEAIVFLERSESNFIEKISLSQAFPFLVQQTYIPKDKEKAKKVLSLLSQAYDKTTFWRFQCNNFKEDSFKKAYTALVEKEIQP